MGTITLDVRSGATVGALLGALVECGASLRTIGRDLAALGPGPVPIALRRSRSGSYVRLHAPTNTPAVRPWSQHRDRLALLAVDDEVAACTVRVLETLTRGRAVSRGVSLDEVAVDPIAGLDETAAVLALASAVACLDQPTIRTTAVGVGSGTMRTVFGEVVLPGPVVAEVLAARRTQTRPFAVELVDPVSAAFLAARTTQLPDAAADAAVDDVDVRAHGTGRGAVISREGDVGAVLAVIS